MSHCLLKPISILLCFALAGVPAGAAIADGVQKDGMEPAIDQYIDQVRASGKIPGVAIAIVQGEETIFLKGYGVAGGNRPVTPQTPFTICSVGKTFTAFAIRQLAAQGKVDYDEPVQAYIPWFELADPGSASQITIGDLISHKSGLSRESGTQSWLYDPNLTLEDAVRRLKSVHPAHPAGSSEEYSNLNFVLLGLVIQAVSGMPYEDYIQSNVFEPLGMAHSYLHDAEARKDGSAAGYSVAYGIPIPLDIPQPKGMTPAGFQQTCAEDLAKFAKLYLNNGYLNGKSVFAENPLPEQKPPFEKYDNSTPRYGIYWMPESGPVGGYQGYYGHEGRSSNFSTMLMVNPYSKRAIIVLTNCVNGAYDPPLNAATIANDIAAMLEMHTGLPQRTAGYGSKWINTVALGAVILLLALRFFWISRFRRNLARGKGRRAAAVISYALLDGALPLAALVSLPMIFQTPWPVILGNNPELGILILLVCPALLSVFAAKTIILIITRAKAHSKEAAETGHT